MLSSAEKLKVISFFFAFFQRSVQTFLVMRFLVSSIGAGGNTVGRVVNVLSYSRKSSCGATVIGKGLSVGTLRDVLWCAFVFSSLSKNKDVARAGVGKLFDTGVKMIPKI